MERSERGRPHPAEGSKPLKRGPGRESGRDRPKARACLHARVPQGFGLGACDGRRCESQEGRGGRKADRSPQEQALKGETPGARPVETHRGDRGGSKASKPAGTARTQLDPEEATPGVVAHRGTVALGGRETSGERCTREVRASPGRALKRGKSLWEAAHSLIRVHRPGPHVPHGGRTTQRPRQTDEAQGPGGYSGRPSNRMRADHRAVMRRVIARMMPERSEEGDGEVGGQAVLGRQL